MKVKEKISNYKKLEFGNFFKNVFWKPNTSISDDELSEELDAIIEAEDSDYITKLENSVEIDRSTKSKKADKAKKQNIEVKTVTPKNKEKYKNQERENEEQER